MNVRPFNELPHYYRHIRHEIFRSVPENSLKILDVGCGAGVLGKALKEQNSRRHITGIELNNEACHYAKLNLDVAYNEDIELFEPPFLDQEFDCIIFADILEHLKDPWNAIKLYTRFLKHGGTVISSIPNIRHLPTLSTVIEKGSWEYKTEGILDATHLRFFAKKDFLQLLGQANIVCNSINYLGGQEIVRWIGEQEG
jgi:2-polyprenyl-3-methyl-5-hydroxy-6-metoxy-1,4-benzoquinol methylase